MLVKRAIRANPVAEWQMHVEMTDDHGGEPGASHVPERSATQWEARLAGDLLKEVSRSFYISLKLLPGRVRGPICLGYLLARTSDTIADTETISAEERLAFLSRYEEAIVAAKPITGLQAELVKTYQPRQTHEGERVLLEHVSEALSWLGAVSGFEREAAQTLLKEIIHGQKLDCERFGTPGELRFLAKAEDLEEYSYLVAGSVGVYWTRLCDHHCKNFAADSNKVMLGRARAYGRALQLINILRDLPEDFKNGRCYLPREELQSDTPSPEALKEVSQVWEKRCEEQLDEALDYCLAVKPARLRYATALPMLLAYRTLALLRGATWEERQKGVKVSRSEVKGIMARAMVANTMKRRLGKLADELRVH